MTPQSPASPGPTDPHAPVITVSAALIADAGGRQLLVRKRGTGAFMQAGGKPEPGEDPLAAVVREIAEELGVTVDPARVRALGPHETVAANEPGHRLLAHVFAVDGVTEVAATAEIEEVVWVDLDQAARLPLAPLTATLLGLDGSGSDWLARAAG